MNRGRGRAPEPESQSIRTKPAPDVNEFQPDAIELEDRAPPRIARLALYGVTALIAAAVGFACVAEIDEIVVAEGKLITTEPTIVIQPLETSIVRSLDVSAGDRVTAGQTLARLDATFSQSDADQQRARLAALDAQVRRLEAELQGRDFRPEGDSPDELLQAELFRQRRAYVAAQLRNFDQQIAGQASIVASNGDRRKVLLERRETLAQIEQARQSLYEKEAGSLLNLLVSRDARLDIDSSLAELGGLTVEAEHAMDKLKADRLAFLEDFRRAAIDQLIESRSQRDVAAEELKKMELRRQMVVLAAPADAVVLDMAPRSIGSVVREAEPIVTLVPLDVPLEAEVSVRSRDIGRLAAGSVARLKFEAFPFQKFGTVEATIRTISRDAFEPDPAEHPGRGQAPVFKARLNLSQTGWRDADGQPIHFLPGMSVTAEIKVGRRSVISYFIHPLIRGLDESIREPG